MTCAPIGRTGIVLALLVASALTIAARGAGAGREDDPYAVAKEFGVPAPAWRVEPSRRVPGYRFAAFGRQDAVPCLAYVGHHGGGSCFPTVGRRGGWALEATVRPTPTGAFVIGVAVPQARWIRLGRIRGSMRALAPESETKRFGVRYFIAAVPRAALAVNANSIVALDALGRLLGRQHYNDGRGGAGPRDGIWEREFDRAHARSRGRPR